ncbi:MAG: NifB/NifX family molybdenum-iron cluster-binding protein [Candidatus Thorarchaeota archaeon]
MKRRVLVPSEDENGSVVAMHFGRAPYFSMFDIDEDGNIINKEVHTNRGEHAGGRGHAHDNVLTLQPNVIIVQGMGPRGLRSFQSQSIAVLQANSRDVNQVVQSYIDGNLQELTDGCDQARHA